MRTLNTTQLFYNKYPFKLVCRLDLANEFRGSRFSYVRKILDNLQKKYDNGEELNFGSFRPRNISVTSFKDAQLIYNTLEKEKDFRFRIQFKELTVYSTNKQPLEYLRDNLSTVLEWWEPEQELSPLEPGYVYLKKDNGFKFRVTIKGSINSDAADWILSNQDKVKIGPTFHLSLLEKMYYLDNFYFYAKNERTLVLIDMILGANVRRVDKVVATEENA